MPTRARMEELLVGRVRLILQLVQMDATTAGTNAALDDPLAYGMRESGRPLVDPTTVTDADLAALPTGALSQVLDMAEWRLLESIESNLVYVRTRINLDEFDYSSLRQTLEIQVARVAARITKLYRVGRMAIGPIAAVAPSYPGARVINE